MRITHWLGGAALLCLLPATALAAEGHGFQLEVHGLYIVDFLALAGLLYWFGKKPISRFMNERAETITAEIKEAQAIRAAAEEKLKEYEARLADLEQERERIVKGFIEDGERERDRIVREAEHTADKMVAEAERRIEQETKRLEESLEHEAVELAIVMGEKAVRDRLSAGVQQQLVKDYIRGLESQESKDAFATA